MMLEVTGLEKRYDQVVALAGLNLRVEAGEFFVLLGPSASGKTTTLRSIAGVERVDAGCIRVASVDMTYAPVQHRDMAMIFQSFALYPHLTVFDNLAYPLRERGVSARDIHQRVNEIAGQLGLSHTLARKPETASGGEQQRIAIGRALIWRPKLLLLDEPLTNLDAKLRHDTRAELKRLHRDSAMTMLYATPDELEALSMGQRIGVLRDGRIVQTGTPDELYDEPANAYVASMVGSPKMNLVPGIHTAATAGAGVKLSFGDVSGGPWATALAHLPVGTRVLFGIRPHDLEPVDGAATGPRMTARVHLTEPLGDITVLDLQAGDAMLKMVLPEDRALRYGVGDAVTVAIRLDRSHVFAEDTGNVIR